MSGTFVEFICIECNAVGSSVCIFRFYQPVHLISRFQFESTKMVQNHEFEYSKHLLHFIRVDSPHLQCISNANRHTLCQVLFVRLFCELFPHSVGAQQRNGSRTLTKGQTICIDIILRQQLLPFTIHKHSVRCRECVRDKQKVVPTNQKQF